MAENTDGKDGPNDSGSVNSSLGASSGDTSNEWSIIGSGGAIDPASASSGRDGSGTDSGTGNGKRRGRKPGTKNASKQKTQADIGLLAGGLVFLHHGLSEFLKVQELELSDDEAEKLTKSSLEVMAHYQIVPSDKAMAWMALIAAIGGIYGTRYVAFKMRMKVEKEQRESAASNVVNMGMSANGFAKTTQ